MIEVSRSDFRWFSILTIVMGGILSYQGHFLGPLSNNEIAMVILGGILIFCLLTVTNGKKNQIFMESVQWTLRLVIVWALLGTIISPVGLNPTQYIQMLLGIFGSGSIIMYLEKYLLTVQLV